MCLLNVRKEWKIPNIMSPKKRIQIAYMLLVCIQIALRCSFRFQLTEKSTKTTFEKLDPESLALLLEK